MGEWILYQQEIKQEHISWSNSQTVKETPAGASFQICYGRGMQRSTAMYFRKTYCNYMLLYKYCNITVNTKQHFLHTKGLLP